MNALEIHEQAERIADPEARRRFLDEACRGDDALRARVEAMLGIGTVPDAFLGRPVLDRPAAAAAAPTDESVNGGAPGTPTATDPLLGAMIGGVRLERLVGRGGSTPARRRPPAVPSRSRS